MQRKLMPVSSLTRKPIFLWFLGHELDHDELRRQVRLFDKKGWGGFIMHWISGGEPYMGRRWMDGLEVIIRTAADRGLEAWLYDEAWCPSGFAGGRLIARRPDLSMHVIGHEIRDVKAGDEAVIDIDLMQILDAVALPLIDGVPQPDGRVDLTAELGPFELDQDPPYRHTRGYYPHVTPLEHWRQAARRRVWRLRWGPGSGAWRVYLFWAENVNRGAEGHRVTRVDGLQPATAEEFLAETHAKYEERFGQYFGTVIPGIMTDEAKFNWMPWSPVLPAAFRNRTGQDLVAGLPALFDATHPDTLPVRLAYHGLVSDLFRQNFMEPIGRWCDEHGLLLTGHISPEEDPTHESDLTGNIPRLLESFHIPGTDLIIETVGNAERPALNLGPRLVSSAAHQQGKSRVFVEVGATCEEGVGIEDLKHFCDWLMVNGINLICVHGLNYSDDGFRKFYAGQTFSYQTNLWHHMDRLTGYLEERSRLLCRLRPHREVAVLRPFTAIRALSPPPEDAPDAREALDEALIALTWELLTRHVEFDFLEEDTVESWDTGNATLGCGEAAYRVVVVPACNYLSPAVYRSLLEWVQRGGRVLCVGNAPEPADTPSTDDGSDFESCPDVTAAVRQACEIAPPAVEIRGDGSRDILAAHLRGSDEEGTLLLNLLEREVSIEVRAPRWNGPVTLAPRECRALPDDPCVGPSIPLPADQREHRLDGPWQVEAREMNHVPLLASPTRITVERGAEVVLLVLDRDEKDLVSASLTLDGELPDWDTLRPEAFYDHMNLVMPLSLSEGDHTFALDVTPCPTILLAGRFSAHATGPGYTLRKEAGTADGVRRIESGYPFLRGPLCFRTEFTLEADTPAPTVLSLPGRKGTVTVTVDGKERGTVAWPPDSLVLGSLAAGTHTLELAVVGDGIGILRTGPYAAGLTDAPRLVW